MHRADVRSVVRTFDANCRERAKEKERFRDKDRQRDRERRDRDKDRDKDQDRRGRVGLLRITTLDLILSSMALGSAAILTGHARTLAPRPSGEFPQDLLSTGLIGLLSSIFLISAAILSDHARPFNRGLFENLFTGSVTAAEAEQACGDRGAAAGATTAERIEIAGCGGRPAGRQSWRCDALHCFLYHSLSWSSLTILVLACSSCILTVCREAVSLHDYQVSTSHQHGIAWKQLMLMLSMP